MKNEQEVIRSVFDAYIREVKTISTKKDRPTVDMLEKVKNIAIKALEQTTSDDCVSRTEALKELKESAEHHVNNSREEVLLRRDRDIIRALPLVIHIHGTCKDCKHCCFITGTKNRVCEKHGCMQVSNNWYCADFEKRGNEE